MLTLTAGTALAGELPTEPTPVRQSLQDAWWTGPLLASSASTLPRGHALVEPYLYRSITNARFDADGHRQPVPRASVWGSLTYLLYGLTDRLTVGLIPQFGFAQPSQGPSSSGIAAGDLGLQAQYRLTQFREGRWIPTTSLVVGETLPTGRYDRLGTHPSDGFGAGAHTTTVALYSQYYFWMPNGRILRSRFDVSYSWSDTVALQDVSVYGTPDGFHGSAQPGPAFTADLANEYSLTRRWVLALDVIYQHQETTRVSGKVVPEDGGGPPATFAASSGSSASLGFAPAIEYNWNSRRGVIAGMRFVTHGRNVTAPVLSVVAINMVF
jgi:hypothetical protein